MSNQAVRHEGISAQTDNLSSQLFGDALDLLADGQDFGVLLVIQADDDSISSFEFSDDGPDACLEAAREQVISAKKSHLSGAVPVRYALVYEGAVAGDDGAYHDALLMEFGERGWCAYSAFSFYEGRGAGDGFQWSEPAPAGEVEPLL